MEKISNESASPEGELLRALEVELRGMEERNPEMRKDGKGDPKYEILWHFLNHAREGGFEDIYAGLQDPEKHAVLTRLENLAYRGEISWDFVDRKRRELYGVRTYNNDNKDIDFDRQAALEQILQDRYFNRKNE